jgi:hypothetical protein
MKAMSARFLAGVLLLGIFIGLGLIGSGRAATIAESHAPASAALR